MFGGLGRIEAGSSLSGQANRKEPRPTTSTDLFGATAGRAQTSLFETGTGSCFGLFGQRQSSPTATSTTTNLFSSQDKPGGLFGSGTIPPVEMTTTGFQFSPTSQPQQSISGANNANEAATTITATQPLFQANSLMPIATASPTNLFGTPISFPFFGFPSLFNFMVPTAFRGFQEQFFPSAVQQQQYFPGYIPLATTPYRHNPFLSSPTTTATPSAVTQKKKRGRGRPPTLVIPDYITVFDSDPPMYQCNICQKKFKTKGIIKSHEFCQNGRKPYNCKECGKGFFDKWYYEYHLRTTYICPKCGKGFNHLATHMHSHPKPFICQECNRGFDSSQALTSHFVIHSKETVDFQRQTSERQSPHTCDHCSRKFFRNWDLRRHLVICNGERPFKCSICSQAFNRKDTLKDHINNTHNQLGSEFYDWMSIGGAPGERRDASISDNEMPIDLRINVHKRN